MGRGSWGVGGPPPGRLVVDHGSLVVIRGAGRADEAICKLVVMARQVSTNTGLRQVGTLQVSHFAWIMASRGDCGAVRNGLATFRFLWIMNFPSLGFPFEFGFLSGLIQERKMKKLLALLVASAFVASSAFAQQQAGAAGATGAAAGGITAGMVAAAVAVVAVAAAASSSNNNGTATTTTTTTTP